MKEVQVAKARAFYGFQITIENIHSKMYSLLLKMYIKDSEEKHRLFHAIDTIPCVAKKAQWTLRWIGGSESFAKQIMAAWRESYGTRWRSKGSSCATRCLVRWWG
ncbi:hypothetical protein ACFX13_003501 [Malus domestica]|uniref:Uncharacterized protein n=1 Tax=Malus domestica TaxID=3750 RepID=A0A498J189_MALDO|nr:hypothetical protein DVH24_034473 [Malus domestica]